MKGILKIKNKASITYINLAMVQGIKYGPVDENNYQIRIFMDVGHHGNITLSYTSEHEALERLAELENIISWDCKLHTLTEGE